MDVRGKAREQWAKGLVRGVGGSLLTLALVLASPTPALADVQGEMDRFMSDMGVQANVSGPAAYNGQSAGYYTMGSVWSRFPQRNIQPFNIQLPHARAGCGGIDLFAGSFSFINTAELVAMLKATANNALGFAFKLAIDTISPEIGKVMDELAQKVQQMNQFNMSSCETAQALVGGLWPRSDAASSEICKAVANSQGAVADWARARQQCNNGGQRDALKNGNTDPAMQHQPGMRVNYTWHALQTKYSGFDDEFKEFLMTLVGTVIYDPANGAEGVRPIAAADNSLVTSLLDGTSAAPLKIWKCDETTECMHPSLQDVTVAQGKAIKPRVKALLQSMFTKARDPNQALSPAEVQLIGMASVPVYKILTVSAASEFTLDPEMIDNLGEIVAVDLVTTMAMRFFDLGVNSSQMFEAADEASLAEWREGMRDARNHFGAVAVRTSAKFDQVFLLIQRTQMMEKTLRSTLSPKMTAALRFSKSVGGRM